MGRVERSTRADALRSRLQEHDRNRTGCLQGRHAAQGRCCRRLVRRRDLVVRQGAAAQLQHQGVRRGHARPRQRLGALRDRAGWRGPLPADLQGYGRDRRPGRRRRAAHPRRRLEAPGRPLFRGAAQGIRAADQRCGWMNAALTRSRKLVEAHGIADRMASKVKRLIVAGHGASGLAAAVAAAEEARRRNAAVELTILEKAREEEAGGNTRFSPSYMRMAAPDRIAPGFEVDIRAASGGRGDADYFRTLSRRAVPTITWLQHHGVEFAIPSYYLSVGPPRIQPVGGGLAIVERLGRSAKMADIAILYESAATRLILSQGRISGIELRSADGATSSLEADAVVLATGGFQGDSAMMQAQFG